MMNDITVFGKRLKEWRLKRGYTQRALAEVVTVPFETISRLENGRQHPSWGMAVLLANALRVSVAVFAAPADRADPA